MPAVVLNVLINRLLENNVYFLEEMTKSKIIDALQEAAGAKSYALGLADYVDMPSIENPSDLITAKEWLDDRGIDWNKSDRRKFETYVSQQYYERYGYRPPKVLRSGGPNTRWSKKVAGYQLAKDKDLFLDAYDVVIESQNLRGTPT